MKKSVALFLGRFQPLHRGHLHIMQRLAKKGYALKIAIGSAQEAGTDLNPFSLQQRKIMLRRALRDAGIKGYRLFGVPDIGDDEAYVAHVRKIAGPFDVVHAAENPLTYRLFRDAGYVTYRCKRWEGISSTAIRQSWLHRSALWTRMVPACNTDLIMRWNHRNHGKKASRKTKRDS